MRKILSIDGGGIRGIIPALVLAEIEQRTGRPISELFDLIAGTSTGGILALGLSKPDASRRPQYSAEDLVSLYEDQGATIFHKPSWRRLFERKYNAAGIEQVLERFFGDTRLKSALNDVLITSYEIERRFPFFFRSSNARLNQAYDFPMKQAARATSAAPTYFTPLKIKTGGTQGYYALVDGGLFANNPALCALVEAHTLYGAGEVLMVSLGTGALSRPFHYDSARCWGLAKWAKPVMDIALDGVSSTVDFQLRHLLPAGYYRLQTSIDPSLQQMDNTSPSNLRDLKLLGEALIRERSGDIDRICTTLTTPGPIE